MIGRKDVLIARAFATHEAQLPVALTGQEADMVREEEYRHLLMTEDERPLPDPLDSLSDE